MPRQRRLWEPGDLLSIVGRGYEGRPLFASDDDRRFFVERLARVFRPADVDLLAWALLVSHLHPDAPTARVTRREAMPPAAARAVGAWTRGRLAPPLLALMERAALPRAHKSPTPPFHVQIVSWTSIALFP